MALIDPKRLAVLKYLTDYLAREVTFANGYQHDLSNKAGAVCRGRLFRDRDNDPLPMVSILEDLDPERYPRMAGQFGYEHTTDRDDWILLVQGWAGDDECNPTDPAYRLMADVQMAIAKLANRGDPSTLAPAPPEYNMGGLVTSIKVETGVARPPLENVSKNAFFWSRVVLGFVEDKNDPYDLQ